MFFFAERTVFLPDSSRVEGWQGILKPSGYGQEGEKRALARDDLIQEHHGFDTDHYWPNVSKAMA